GDPTGHHHAPRTGVRVRREGDPQVRAVARGAGHHDRGGSPGRGVGPRGAPARAARGRRVAGGAMKRSFDIAVRGRAAFALALVATLGALASSCAYYNTFYLARKYYDIAALRQPYVVDR